MLDLQSGYWQVTISPEDRERKKWVMVLIMPLGLCTAPVTFGWLMKGLSSLQFSFFFLIATTSAIELYDNSQTEGHLAIKRSLSTIRSRTKKHMMWRNGVGHVICVQPESLGNIILIHDTQEDWICHSQQCGSSYHYKSLLITIQTCP